MFVSTPKGSEPSQPLMGQIGRFDNFDDVPEISQQSCIGKWGPRIVSIGGVGASLACRILVPSPKLNVLYSFCLGAFAQASITTAFSSDSLPRIRQVCLTAFGQLSLFALTQWYFNADSSAEKKIPIDMIIALLGANLWLMVTWARQHGPIRTESNTNYNEGEKFTDFCLISDKASWIAKTAVSAGLISTSFRLDDPFFSGLCSFAGWFYFAQNIGEMLSTVLDNIIESVDGDLPGGFLNTPRFKCLHNPCFNWRKIKTSTITLASLGLVIVPWLTKPSSKASVLDLAMFGGLIGALSGLPEKSEATRIKKIPIDHLTEFKKQETPDKEKTPYRYVAYRIWHISNPIIINLGVAGIGAWLEGLEIHQKASKVAFGIFYAGFAVSYNTCKLVDWLWTPNYRNKLTDKLMKSIWVSPRIFGMHPLFIYYAVTNSTKMRGSAVAAASASRKTMLDIAWGSYGIAMGREIYATSSDRFGSPQWLALMFLINAVDTTLGSLFKEIEA